MRIEPGTYEVKVYDGTLQYWYGEYKELYQRKRYAISSSKMKAGTYKVIIDDNGNEHWYDANENNIYFYNNKDGFEFWKDFNEDNIPIHYKNSLNYEWWCNYDSEGRLIHYKKVGPKNEVYERWTEFDSEGQLIHYKKVGPKNEVMDSWYHEGIEVSKEEYDRLNNSIINDIIVTIDGEQYKLVKLS